MKTYPPVPRLPDFWTVPVMFVGSQSNKIPVIDTYDAPVMVAQGPCPNEFTAATLTS